MRLIAGKYGICIHAHDTALNAGHIKGAKLPS